MYVYVKVSDPSELQLEIVVLGIKPRSFEKKKKKLLTMGPSLQPFEDLFYIQIGQQINLD